MDTDELENIPGFRAATVAAASVRRKSALETEPQLKDLQNLWTSLNVRPFDRRMSQLFKEPQPGLTYEVFKTGNVTYRLNSHFPSFVYHKATQFIEVKKDPSLFGHTYDEDKIAAALALAVKEVGIPLTITGPHEFKSAAFLVAQKYGVTVANPELQVLQDLTQSASPAQASPADLGATQLVQAVTQASAEQQSAPQTTTATAAAADDLTARLKKYLKSDTVPPLLGDGLLAQALKANPNEIYALAATHDKTHVLINTESKQLFALSSAALNNVDVMELAKNPQPIAINPAGALYLPRSIKETEPRLDRIPPLFQKQVDVIKNALNGATSWQDIQERLKPMGMSMVHYVDGNDPAHRGYVIQKPVGPENIVRCAASHFGQQYGEPQLERRMGPLDPNDPLCPVQFIVGTKIEEAATQPQATATDKASTETLTIHEAAKAALLTKRGINESKIHEQETPVDVSSLGKVEVIAIDDAFFAVSRGRGGYSLLDKASAANSVALNVGDKISLTLGGGAKFRITNHGQTVKQSRRISAA